MDNNYAETMNTPNNIFVCGDLHGDWGAIYALLTYAKKGDCAIAVGDFGVGFSSIQADTLRLSKLNRRLADAGVRLYIARGNHDAPQFWNNDYTREFFDFENIVFAKDFSIHEILGQKVGFIGGGVSVDRKYRTAGKDYWIDEVVPVSEDYTNLSNLDVLITHTCPSNFSPYGGDLNNIMGFINKDLHLLHDLRAESDLMAKYYNYVFGASQNLKRVYAGHFHASHTIIHNEITFKVLDINEIHSF